MADSGAGDSLPDVRESPPAEGVRGPAAKPPDMDVPRSRLDSLFPLIALVTVLLVLAGTLIDIRLVR